MAGVIGPADRSAQYTSNDYLEFLQARQMRPFVGRTGVCGNAMAEALNGTFKAELVTLRHLARAMAHQS